MATADANNITIQPEATPNPASMRFVIDRPVLEAGTAEIVDAAQAECSPLAKKLFALAGVSGVFLGPNFVTVTAGNANWQELRDAVMEQIRAHYASGEAALEGQGDTDVEGLGETEQGVLRVIEEEIRPAVAMDGGDVVFDSFKDGIVYLRLRGACSGCPSAVFTLKMGIERRLKAEFPEIVSVEAL